MRMKEFLKYIFIITILLLIVAIPVYAVSGFQQAAEKYLSKVCKNGKAGGVPAVLCYFNDRIIDLEDKVDNLEERVDELEESCQTPSPSPSSSPSPSPSPSPLSSPSPSTSPSLSPSSSP